MVNLLTKQTKSELLMKYYTRLATLVFVSLGCAALFSALLLLPSYFVIHAEADQASSYVSTVTAIADERAKSQAAEDLAVFKEEVAFLDTNRREARVARMLSTLTAEVPRGISIDSLVIDLSDPKTIQVATKGIAATRAILVAYRDQLKKSGDFLSASIPVSDLVADVNSGFSMNLVVETKTP